MSLATATSREQLDYATTACQSTGVCGQSVNSMAVAESSSSPSPEIGVEGVLLVTGVTILAFVALVAVSIWLMFMIRRRKRRRVILPIPPPISVPMFVLEEGYTPLSATMTTTNEGHQTLSFMLESVRLE
jgi:hypothetical protein